MHRQPVFLPRGASGLQDEAPLTDTLIVGVVRGMKNHAQLTTPLDGQSLPSGDLGHLFWNSGMPLCGADADVEVPVEETIKGQCHRSNPDVEAAL